MTATGSVRHYGRVRRMIGWIVFYLVVLEAFVAIVYWQGSQVNTSEFAKGQLELTTSKTTYTQGDTVSFTLKNRLSQPITMINDCPHEPLHVYQWKNQQWTAIHDTKDTVSCVGQPAQTVIPVNGVVTKDYARWPSLFDSPGIYRLVVYASNYTSLPYADFQVVAKPAQAAAPKVYYVPVPTPVYIPVYTPSAGGGSDD